MVRYNQPRSLMTLPSNKINLRLQQQLTQLKAAGLYRQHSALVATECINFSSNDYLSLLAEPTIQQAYQTGFSHYPAGSGSSMVVCGYHPIHQTLENTMATLLGVERCLLFSSGYAANLSVMNFLAQHEIPIVVDKAAHASIYDGLRLANATYQRYRHQDLTDLKAKLQQVATPSAIVTEGIFSMSGQIAPLAFIKQIAPEQALVVDEAHAFGIFGQSGLGAVAAAGLTEVEVPLRIIPFGKACAGWGAMVAGQGLWVEALLQAARSHIYSTAMSPAYAYGLLQTIEWIYHADDRRAKLWQLVSYFRQLIQQSTFQWRDSTTPIQQLQFGCPHRAQTVAAMLRESGIICLPMRQPTVSKQETGLRIMLNYQHQPEQLDYLFECLQRL